MKKVLLVTRGEYSDYCVLAAFDDHHRTAAKKLANRYGGEIEEYELNPIGALALISGKGYSGWHVYMKRDGTVMETHTIEAGSGFEPIHGTDWKILSSMYIEKTKQHTKYPVIWVTCIAKSEKHAIKIANEQRTASILAGEWEK
jgi:hypothetical protein